MRIIHTEDLTETTPLSPDDKSWIYNGLDCLLTHEIFGEINHNTDEVAQRTYQFSKALQGPVLEMQLRGLRVDQNRRTEVLSLFSAQSFKVERNLNRILKEAFGVEINWRSPKQLQVLFYDIMRLPQVRKRNAKGQMVPTVGRDALERFCYHFYAEPIALHILTLRDLGKKIGFLNTGIDTDGRFRANFNIAGTNTGRLSSSASDFGTGSNLQNVDRDLRSIFVADEGMKFCNVDLEQADGRNLAAFAWNLFFASHGPEFAGSFLDAAESGDLHTTVCRMAWTDLDWPDDKGEWRAVADRIAYRNFTYRDLAKRLGHGTNFGGQPPTMAKHSKVAKHMIESFQRRYFAAFPVIRAYHEWIGQQLRTKGYITTPFGRRRYFFDRADDPRGLLKAIAYSPQSMTAEEINIAMLRIYRAGLYQLLVQVHDSILFQYPEDKEDEYIPLIQECFDNPIILEGGRPFCVPCDIKTGWNWGDVKYDKEGKVVGNAAGLKKWKGHDERRRPRASFGQRNLKALLSA